MKAKLLLIISIKDNLQLIYVITNTIVSFLYPKTFTHTNDGIVPVSGTLKWLANASSRGVGMLRLVSWPGGAGAEAVPCSEESRWPPLCWWLHSRATHFPGHWLSCASDSSVSLSLNVNGVAARVRFCQAVASRKTRTVVVTGFFLPVEQKQEDASCVASGRKPLCVRQVCTVCCSAWDHTSP